GNRDCCLHVLGRRVDVAIEVKLNDDRSGALRAHRGHLRNAWDLSELTLQGAATEAAMVSALAPCNVALTLMVGKSTCGKGATGRNGYATRPTKPIAAIRSDVATGRRTKGSEMFTAGDPVVRAQHRPARSLSPAHWAAACIVRRRPHVRLRP